MLLLQGHLEFQVVTPRSLGAFRGSVLLLPDARCIGPDELAFLRSYAASGKTLIVTGETGRYDETGAELTRNPVDRLLGFTVAGEKQTSSSGKKFVYYPRCPAREYYAALRTEFDGAAGRGNDRQTRFRGLRQSFLQELVDVSHFRPAVEIDASPFAATQIASVDGSTRVFIANFKGLKANEIAQQMPETNVRVVFHTGRTSPVYLLPFLGQRQKLECVSTKASLTCSIPEIAEGGVISQESIDAKQQKNKLKAIANLAKSS
jgi:hypothetical protein